MNEIPSAPRPRRFTTPEQRLDFVRRYLESGLTQEEFARQNGFSVAALYKWLAQARAAGHVPPGQLPGRSPVRPPALQEIPLGSVLPAAPWAAELRQPSGAVLSIGAGLPAPLLNLLLQRL